ncbi:MAG: 23S rRNA (uracil(1939)-C(5))-methyltransferase RlmD [Bacillota bacterium]|nr:23S rRNA (uracil(1939)-C(5))-methyltransferase RlmD [Bacillota bacterium]
MKENKPELPCKTGDKYNLLITDLNHRGEGVGKIDGYTIFTDGALPGEKVEVKINAAHKNYASASLINVLDESPDRIQPECPYFGNCGGCQIQHLSYPKQLDWKRSRVSETLKRISGINAEVKPVLGMNDPWHYRNKAQVHFQIINGRIAAGFFEKESHNVIDISECPVQHPQNSTLINILREALTFYLKDNCSIKIGQIPLSGAILRSSFTDVQNLVIFNSPSEKHTKAYAELAELVNKISDKKAKGILVRQQTGSSFNKPVILSGLDYIEETIAPFRYKISASSFFQVNSRQAAVLYKVAAELADKSNTAYDLYCGTGNFTLHLSLTAKKVIGVDSNPSAIADAIENAAFNGVKNADFVCARVEEINNLINIDDRPVTVFLNPPRGGCSNVLLERVGKTSPDQVVYISCNPATLARDLKQMVTKGYTINQVQPIDMFPHTSHVETVVLITRV